MPDDQGREGGLVAVGRVSGQELGVAQADGRAVVEQVAKVPQGPTHRQAARHRLRSALESVPSAGRRSSRQRIDCRSLQCKRGAGCGGASISPYFRTIVWRVRIAHRAGAPADQGESAGRIGVLVMAKRKPRRGTGGRPKAGKPSVADYDSQWKEALDRFFEA